MVKFMPKLYIIQNSHVVTIHIIDDLWFSSLSISYHSVCDESDQVIQLLSVNLVTHQCLLTQSINSLPDWIRVHLESLYSYGFISTAVTEFFVKFLYLFIGYWNNQIT